MRVNLSLRGAYAVRAMLALGRHEVRVPAGAGEPPGRLSAARIATEMRIPHRFVAHVLADLGRAGLVIGCPGRNGGYRLAIPAAGIDLLRIVDAAEPRHTAPRCVLRGIPCETDGRCAVDGAFDGATAALRTELARTSLARLVGRA